jgi:hypothetical protein
MLNKTHESPSTKNVNFSENIVRSNIMERGPPIKPGLSCSDKFGTSPVQIAGGSLFGGNDKCGLGMGNSPPSTLPRY